MKKISIIIPTWNEEGNIRLLINRMIKAFQKTKIIYELIIVDDHSIDKTRNIVKTLSQKYPLSLSLS